MALPVENYPRPCYMQHLLICNFQILLLSPYHHTDCCVNRFYNPVIVHSPVRTLKYYDCLTWLYHLPEEADTCRCYDCNGKYDDTENISYDLDVITKDILN